jgi:predicted DNA-binding protein (MmcQ/YjbR family)
VTPEAFHQTALALAGTTVDVKWELDRVYSVGGKMFAVVGPINTPDPRYKFKASDMAFDLLIEQGLARPAPYLARAKWVELAGPGALPDTELAAYLAQAHALVAAGLSKKVRRELGLAVLSFALSIGLWAPGRTQAAPQDFAVLEARLSAALASYDVPTVGALWDDRFVTVFPNGHVSHRADRLAVLARPVPPGPSLTSRNDGVDVQYEDDHVAVVTVRSTWNYGESPGEPYLATHVWIRRDGAWRLLSAQIAQVKP